MLIGMRIPGKLSALGIEALLEWAKEIGLEAIDLPAEDLSATKLAVDKAGLVVGTVDAVAVSETLSTDDAVRAQGVTRLKAQIEEVANLGCKVLFAALLPPDKNTARERSLAIFKETYPEIIAHAENHGVSVAMEPYPGSSPYPAIGCTPEMYRMMFDAIPSKALGICYDPSHYVRMGIDYLRVLGEFGDRIHHVHGKDTELLSEGRYLHGVYGAVVRPSIRFSGGDWRYCIPGAGDVNWAKVMAHLNLVGYESVVSIELEDHAYSDTVYDHQEGIVKSAQHLRSVM